MFNFQLNKAELANGQNESVCKIKKNDDLRCVSVKHSLFDRKPPNMLRNTIFTLSCKGIY